MFEVLLYIVMCAARVVRELGVNIVLMGTNFVSSFSGPAITSLSRILKFFLPSMPLVAPIDHTIEKRKVPCEVLNTSHNNYNIKISKGVLLIRMHFPIVDLQALRERYH